MSAPTPGAPPPRTTLPVIVDPAPVLPVVPEQKSYASSAWQTLKAVASYVIPIFAKIGAIGSAFVGTLYFSVKLSDRISNMSLVKSMVTVTILSMALGAGILFLGVYLLGREESDLP